MTTTHPFRTIACAAFVATPLALVACGSGDDASEQTASASTVTSRATASASSSTSETATAAADGESQAAEPGAAAGGAAAGAGGSAADGGAAPTLENPFENGDIQVAQPDPVQGRPATDAESAAISGLVNGLYEQQTLHAFIDYVPSHTCAAALEAQGGAEAFSLEGVPDMPMNQMPGFAETRVSGVTNQTVTDTGDRASADVTVQTTEGPSTSTMVFQHEGGEWKFCS